MAENDFTIGIPGAGASDFAASPVAALNITKTTRKGPPSRGYIGTLALGEPSINGATPIQGPAVADRFLWTVTCLLTSTQARQLTRLKDYATHRAKGIGQAKASPVLRLVDETRYINDYERQQNGRSLLAELDEADNAAQKYGFGVFNVILILGQDFLEPAGALLGDDTDELTFSIQEM